MRKFFKHNDKGGTNKATPIGIPRVVYLGLVLVGSDSRLLGVDLVVAKPAKRQLVLPCGIVASLTIAGFRF